MRNYAEEHYTRVAADVTTFKGPANSCWRDAAQRNSPVSRVTLDEDEAKFKSFNEVHPG